MNNINEYPKLMEVSNDGVNWFTAIVLNKIDTVYYVVYGDSIESLKKEPLYNQRLCFHDENFARDIEPYKELKGAYKDGDVIQVNDGRGAWIDLENPAFDREPSDYRIKPETECIIKLEYVPFDFSDAKCLIGKAVKSKENDLVAIITAIYIDNVIAVGDFQRTFKNLLTDFTFLDGSICGKLKKR